MSLQPYVEEGLHFKGIEEIKELTVTSKVDVRFNYFRDEHSTKLQSEHWINYINHYSEYHWRIRLATNDDLSLTLQTNNIIRKKITQKLNQEN